jgi:hypothetical protein
LNRIIPGDGANERFAVDPRDKPEDDGAENSEPYQHLKGRHEGDPFFVHAGPVRVSE